MDIKARELSQRLFNAALRPDLVATNDPTLFSDAAKAIEDLPRDAHNAAVEAAMAVAGGMAEHPYDNEPEFSVCLHVEANIRALRLPSPGEKAGG